MPQGQRLFSPDKICNESGSDFGGMLALKTLQIRTFKLCNKTK